MSQSPIGAKRLVVGAHHGLKEWLLQRLTAIIMAFYTVILFVAFMLMPDVSQDSWIALFSATWMKILTLLTLLSLFYHAWIGVRDIFMDYIKPLAVRLTLQVLSVLWLLACAAYSVQILWRV